jgi:hypothetical protein
MRQLIAQGRLRANLRVNQPAAMMITGTSEHSSSFKNQ